MLDLHKKWIKDGGKSKLLRWYNNWGLVTPSRISLLLQKVDTSTKMEFLLGNQDLQKDLCLSPSRTRIALNCCSEGYMH